MLPTHDGKFFINPDENTSRICLAAIFTPNDKKHLFILTANRVQMFIKVIRTALPFSPYSRYGAWVLIR